jgi:hypothetical protein
MPTGTSARPPAGSAARHARLARGGYAFPAFPDAEVLALLYQGPRGRRT